MLLFSKFFETATLNNLSADLFGENQYATVEKKIFFGPVEVDPNLVFPLRKLS